MYANRRFDFAQRPLRFLTGISTSLNDR